MARAKARSSRPSSTRIEKHTPQLVSWNGGGFDLPVLHYRGLQHGVVADKYWDLGDDDREFKWNNYISRYHMRHLDLMDLLAMYQPKNNAPLDAMAKLCGFPGKLGMDGSQVYGAYLDGKLDEIRRYCETDVMNTYLVYCRFQKMRGGLTEKEYDQEIAPGWSWKDTAFSGQSWRPPRPTGRSTWRHPPGGVGGRVGQQANGRLQQPGAHQLTGVADRRANTQVGFGPGYPGGDAGTVVVDQTDSDPRVGGTEPPQYARQQGAPKGGSYGQRHGAEQPGGLVAQFAGGLFHVRQQSPGRRQKTLAAGREPQPPGGAVKQCLAQLRFKVLQRTGQRGLADVQYLAGPRDVAQIGRGHKQAQLALGQIHAI
jgi:hypothetical protein